MQPLTINDLVPFNIYAESYKQARQHIIAVKAPRRVAVGESISFLFDNRQPLLYQVQEMLRVEHITDPRKIQDELDTYNELLPGPKELSATMFIQITNQANVKNQLDLLMGIDEKNVAVLQLGPLVVSGLFEQGHSNEDKISAVHFVRFQITDEALEILKDPQYAATLSINHPHYKATAALQNETRDALLNDLST